MAPKLTEALFYGILLSPVVAVMVFNFVNRVQASLLEVLLTLVVSNIPIVVALQAKDWLSERYLAGVMASSFIPALLVWAGVLWALQCLKTMGETRWRQRLRILAIGWFCGIGFVAGPIAVIMLVLAVLRLLFDPYRLLELDPAHGVFVLIGLLTGYCSILAFSVNHRAHSTRVPLNASERDTPARALWLIQQMIDRGEKSLRVSLTGQSDHARICNYLKVSSDLDPLPFKEPTAGRLLISLRQGVMAFEAEFCDGGDDPYFSIRLLDQPE